MPHYGKMPNIFSYWTVKIKRGRLWHFAPDDGNVPAPQTFCGVDCGGEGRLARKNVTVGSTETCPRCLDQLARLRTGMIDIFLTSGSPRAQAEQNADQALGIKRGDSD